MTKLFKNAAIAIATSGLVVSAAPAMAAPASHPVVSEYVQSGAGEDWNQYRNRRYYRNDYQGYNGQVWRGRDGRYYCRRKNGTTGMIVGGAAGALIGRSIDGGRNRTLGTIVGAAGGALLGREIQRSGSRCR